MIDLSSIYFGLFLGIFPFTLVKVIQQSRKIVLRSRTFRNAYLYMIWVEAVVNFVFAIITYLYLIGLIAERRVLNLPIDTPKSPVFLDKEATTLTRRRNSLAFFIGTVIVWAIQTQLLSQIIANRVGLIIVNKRKGMWLKLGLLFAIGSINLAVGIIWINAHMPGATAGQIYLNNAFEKAEKTFFLLTDLGLNLYFLYLVRFRLIALGLSKYWLLFKVNVAIVFLSTGMDALLLGMLSLPDPYLYVQFAPVAYIVKLYIELTMAGLIAKIIRNRNEGCYGYSTQSASHRRKSNTHCANFREPSTSCNTADRNNMESPTFGNDTQVNRGGDESDIQLTKYAGDSGIVKTVTTSVVMENGLESGRTNSAGQEHENPRDLW